MKMNPVYSAAPFIHFPLFYEVSANLINEAFNGAPTHPSGCLHPSFVAVVALQGALHLFTATLHVQMSCCTYKH